MNKRSKLMPSFLMHGKSICRTLMSLAMIKMKKKKSSEIAIHSGMSSVTVPSALVFVIARGWA